VLVESESWPWCDSDKRRTPVNRLDFQATRHRASAVLTRSQRERRTGQSGAMSENASDLFALREPLEERDDEA
jgi:hypothetical protein